MTRRNTYTASTALVVSLLLASVASAQTLSRDGAGDGAHGPASQSAPGWPNGLDRELAHQQAARGIDDSEEGIAASSVQLQDIARRCAAAGGQPLRERDTGVFHCHDENGAEISTY